MARFQHGSKVLVKVGFSSAPAMRLDVIANMAAFRLGVETVAVDSKIVAGCTRDEFRVQKMVAKFMDPVGFEFFAPRPGSRIQARVRPASEAKR